MASPTRSSTGSGQTTSAGTTHTLNFSSPTAGQLIVVLMRFMGPPGTVTFTGYTQLGSDASDASDDQTMVFYRWADGTEGTTDTLSSANSVKWCSLCWVIDGAENPATQAPEISTVAVGTTAANSANPSSVSVTGGPKDVLYLAMMGLDGEGNSPGASPTNYTNHLNNNTGIAGAAATNGGIGMGERAISASSSDDPGTFTHLGANSGWTAWTVVVHPPAAAAPLVLEHGFVNFQDPGVL